MCVNQADGFALLVVIGMVAVASVAIGGLMTAVSVPNETFSNNSARILLSHKARMSSELILRDISENENSIESFALVETSGGASALSEWQQRCKSFCHLNYKFSWKRKDWMTLDLLGL